MRLSIEVLINKRNEALITGDKETFNKLEKEYRSRKHEVHYVSSCAKESLKKNVTNSDNFYCHNDIFTNKIVNSGKPFLSGSLC